MTTIGPLAFSIPATALVLLLGFLQPTGRRLAGIIVAGCWNFLVLFAGNLAAVRLGLWSFHHAGPVFLGVPIEFLVGWAILWGAMPALLPTGRSPWITLGLLTATALWTDIVLMPRLAPALLLDHYWLVGDSALVMVSLAPGYLLAWATAVNRWLYFRAAMQGVMFSSLFVVCLPLAAGQALNVRMAFAGSSQLISVEVQVLFFAGRAGPLGSARTGGAWRGHTAAAGPNPAPGNQRNISLCGESDAVKLPAYAARIGLYLSCLVAGRRDGRAVFLWCGFVRLERRSHDGPLRRPLSSLSATGALMAAAVETLRARGRERRWANAVCCGRLSKMQ